MSDKYEEIQGLISDVSAASSDLVDTVRGLNSNGVAAGSAGKFSDLTLANNKVDTASSSWRASIAPETVTYGSGATETVVEIPTPTLDMDFTAEVYQRLESGRLKLFSLLDDFDVFGNGSTAHDNGGRFTSYPAGEPAFHFAPGTGEPLGVQVMPSTTNQVTYSSKTAAGDVPMGASSHWNGGRTTIRGLTMAEMTHTGVVYKDFFADSQRVAFSTYFYIPRTISSGTVTVIRGEIHGANGNGSFAYVTFDYTTRGFNVATGTNMNAVLKIEDYGGGFYRVCMACHFSGETVIDGCRAAYYPTIDGDTKYPTWYGGLQVENGKWYCTPLVECNGAPATRSAGGLRRYLATNELGNSHSMCFYIEGRQQSSVGAFLYVRGADGLGESVRIGAPSNAGKVIWTGAVSDDGNSRSLDGSEVGGFAAGEPVKICCWFEQGGRIHISVNGKTSNMFIGSGNDYNQMVLGTFINDNNNIAGWIKELRVWVNWKPDYAVMNRLTTIEEY